LLTLLEFICLLLCGLNPYDAAVHSFATAGTGGFSNYGKSIAAFQSVSVEIVITVFMFMFGVNFALYYRFLIGKHLKAFWKDEEFRWYFSFCILFILLVTLFNLPYYGNFFTSLRYGSFEILTTMSTTGFVTADFSKWPVASHLVILLAMFIGSCAGSTAGGIKVIRINMLFKLSRRTIRATSQPKKVEVVRVDGKAVPENTLAQVSLFALMYGMLVLLGAFLLSLGGKYDMITHLSASLTCVSNVGPGFGAVGPVNNFAGYGVFEKFVASFLMLFGRLELLPMFFLFTRSAWHKY
ncbi:MAG: TrkH family potassium uptake protein, partial [Oscillospiraceae bacterium]|nr:TrkH family potassium uptake protein [Oscillospiraceae bacterium]